jgi:hypothetical protein
MLAGDGQVYQRPPVGQEEDRIHVLVSTQRRKKKRKKRGTRNGKTVNHLWCRPTKQTKTIMSSTGKKRTIRVATAPAG